MHACCPGDFNAFDFVSTADFELRNLSTVFNKNDDFSTNSESDGKMYCSCAIQNQYILKTIFLSFLAKHKTRKKVNSLLNEF